MSRNSWKFVIVISLLFILATMLFNIDLPNNSEAPQVTLIIKSKYGTQWELISQGAQAAANEYGADLSILAPDYERDFIAQKSLVESAGTSQDIGVIIAPIIFSEMQETMSTLAAKGIPVMSIVSGQEATGVYSSLSTNYIQVGEELGEGIKEALEGEGQILVVATRNDEEAIALKLSGLRQFVGEEPGMEITEILYAPSDPLSVERVIEDYVGDHIIDGIVSLDEVSTIGMGKTIEKFQLNLGAVGCNIYEDDLYLVDDGYIDGVVVENFFAIGYLAVENSVNKLKDKGAFSHKLISAYRISKDNLYDSEIQKIIFPIK